MILNALCLLAVLLILWRTLHVISVLDIRCFNGSPWQFIGIALHYSLVGAGAVAILIGAPIGGPMMIFGMAFLVISDRRKPR